MSFFRVEVELFNFLPIGRSGLHRFLRNKVGVALFSYCDTGRCIPFKLPRSNYEGQSLRGVIFLAAQTNFFRVSAERSRFSLLFDKVGKDSFVLCPKNKWIPLFVDAQTDPFSFFP